MRILTRQASCSVQYDCLNQNSKGGFDQKDNIPKEEVMSTWLAIETVSFQSLSSLSSESFQLCYCNEKGTAHTLKVEISPSSVYPYHIMLFRYILFHLISEVPE